MGSTAADSRLPAHEPMSLCSAATPMSMTESSRATRRRVSARDRGIIVRGARARVSLLRLAMIPCIQEPADRTRQDLTTEKRQGRSGRGQPSALLSRLVRLYHVDHLRPRPGHGPDLIVCHHSCPRDSALRACLYALSALGAAILIDDGLAVLQANGPRRADLQTGATAIAPLGTHVQHF